MTEKKKKGGAESRPQIDTKALLAGVDIVAIIDARVPLKKSGAEFEACCPFHNEKTPSFKVSPSKQFYNCFGCGANGNAIGFLMEHDGLTFVEACRALGADVPESNTSPAERQPKRADAATKSSASADSVGGAGAREGRGKKKIDWLVVLPAPADAPPAPLAHKFRGKYSRRWEYLDAEGRLLGYVCRFETSDGGKEIIPLTWCRHPDTGVCSWQWVSFPEPKRPLYGLNRLAAKPEATVLLVEGEKCADAAQDALPELVAVSWPGGGKAVDKTDWSPLAGRKVMAWADCDAKRERTTKQEKDAGVDPLSKPLLPPEKQPGVMAMEKAAGHVLALEGARWWDVKIPAPGEKPDGWDIDDAIAEGLNGQSLADFLLAPENRVERQSAQPTESSSTPSEANAGEEKKRPWIPELIYKKGELSSCLSNVYQILAHHPEWRGVVAFDEMALCAVKRRLPPYENSELGEWGSTDDSLTAMWLSREFNFTPSSAIVAEAIEVLARANTWHPVRAWLRSTPWDGVKRLKTWMHVYLGVHLNRYSARVGTWWLMGAVKRVMEPGAKFDYCLVLEGHQGKGKSTVFEILGGAWYGDTELDLAHKDSMSALRGKMIYEFQELGALARSEERRQKSFLSRRIDEYRPVYGRREIKAPRQVVFGGSTNEHEWNKDPTGGRRFWPVWCHFEEIDHQGLRSVRDQLFAEALAMIEAGERYWPTADEQRSLFAPEQLKVEQQDSLIDALHDWVFARVTDFSVADAAMDGLKLDASKLTRDLQTRLGIALRKLGCARFEKRQGMTRFWYKPPDRNAAESKIEQPAQQGSWEGDEYVPF